MDNMNKSNPSKIIGVQFSILSPEEIRKGSVAEITSRDTYVNNKPVIGGLFDPRMGVLDSGIICPTDGHNFINTPGYFGHIELAKPVFYIQYITTILKIIRCVCIKCSKLLIDKTKYKHLLTYSSEDRWANVFTFCNKIKRCGEDTHDGCGCKQPAKLRKEGLATIIAEWDQADDSGSGTGGDAKKMSIKMTPELVLKIFKRISDEDVNFLGFSPILSRPDWMICQTMAVPPPAVRPSVKHDSQQRSEDDLTHIIINIIKANKTLQDKIQQNSNSAIIEDWATVLQYYVATLVDNKIPGVASVAQRSGRPLKSLKERLNGKTGRVRGNLMGKRVDFSARSVITPDPNLSIRELGVPLKIAKNLTKPIVVNPKNRKFLLTLVRNGPDKYPGANIYEKRNGESISLRYVDRDSIVLEDGDIVRRHVIDGDAVLFNRQPTLHRMSMMCHIVKVMTVGDTFRMNVADTKPYNADFDGDEMNLHLPQDDEAECELRFLAAVPYQIISPANNKSIVGIFQDSLLGSYQFTRPDITFDQRTAMNLLMYMKRLDLSRIDFSKSRVSNFDILSQIFPEMSMKYRTKQFRDGDDPATSNNVLEIENGEYLRGQLDKNVLGDGGKGLLQRIYNDYDSTACSEFVDDLQNIITEYMKLSSYSVGISDLIANLETNNRIIDAINSKKVEVRNLIDETHLGIFDNKTGKSNVEEFETRVNNILNKATMEVGKIGRNNLDKDNRFVIMVNAGSKGSDLNISQMISCLGQQNVDGRRIPYGYDSRTLPHFTKYDDSPSARGFVENSFIGGLKPEEMFFHAMGGRVGLIDTAVKSVAWETPIVIIENDQPLYTNIGEWIDNCLEIDKSRIEYHEERNLELLNVDKNIYIPTTDYKGNITWGKITALTRHDPGDKLYKIKTIGGKEVIVTANKSLLIWNPDTKEYREQFSADIKVGDYVPSTQKLCEPPVIINHINIEKYCAKSEYIYGTEFNKAVRLMTEEMDGKKHIPDFWWKNNNEKTFTLPYSSKYSLNRCLNRSNIDNIVPGYIYPYHAQRRNACIPDVFELNYNNGVFIGLYLAEGHISNNSISITNNDIDIQNFVKSWFDKLHINYRISNNTSKYGKSTTITGYNSIITGFIKQIAGVGAKNKHIPSEAYISNIDFVKGLLNGYFSGDGHISKNSIEASSSSKRLIDGINLLCNRLNIFGKVFTTKLKSNNFNTRDILPAHRLSIRAQWGKTFAENIELLHAEKDRILKSNAWNSKNHINFPTHNDTVLDKIVEITVIGTENHPKMYDLTIPETFNFGLANGLQVRDTSSTGYIQRRLIKGMEDLMVHYDMTVRNNKSKIIQFKYGDDCFDPVKIETQQAPFLSMTNEEIYAHFQPPADTSKTREVYTTLYTKPAYSRFKRQKAETNLRCKSYIDYFIQARKEIVEKVFDNTGNKSVNIPVAFSAIINNVRGRQERNIMIDITPLEVFEVIEACFKRLSSSHYIGENPLFKAIFYFYLSPKDLLMKHRLCKASIELLMMFIERAYKQAIIAPGEMVGMVSAQSIGEPTTQLTLNTFHHSGISSKSNVTRGVPRIEEILTLSDNPKAPSCTVFLPRAIETNQEEVQSYINKIEYTRLRDIVDSIDICFDPAELATVVKEDEPLMRQYREFEKMLDECGATEQSISSTKKKSKWIIRMTMNREKMLDKNVGMDDIHFAINNAYKNEISCMYSDYNDDNLVFRMRLQTNVGAAKKRAAASGGLLTPLDQSDEIYMLNNFQDELLDNLILYGVKNISKVLLRKIADNMVEKEGQYLKQELWVLDTVGTNLLEILALDFVDKTRTITNDIIEVYRVLGLEAARQAIKNEFTEVIEDSAYINDHHLNLLVDRMSCNNKLVSIFRHGINNDDIGPIAKASFEETPEMFLKAARHAELDMVKGVSANVMCGQEGYFGTSAFQVVLDINKMAELTVEQEMKDPAPTTEDLEDIIDKEFKNMEDVGEYCSSANIAFTTGIENIKALDFGGHENDDDNGDNGDNEDDIVGF